MFASVSHFLAEVTKKFYKVFSGRYEKMRELIYKNLTTLASKKRDISVEEVVESHGVVSTTKKRSLYFLRGVHEVNSKAELRDWVEERNKRALSNKKFFHILRNYSDKDKEDKLMCKMRGSFYVVSEHKAYNIVFVHAIKINVKKAE